MGRIRVSAGTGYCGDLGDVDEENKEHAVPPNENGDNTHEKCSQGANICHFDIASECWAGWDTRYCHDATIQLHVWYDPIPCPPALKIP